MHTRCILDKDICLHGVSWTRIYVYKVYPGQGYMYTAYILDKDICIQGISWTRIYVYRVYPGQEYMYTGYILDKDICIQGISWTSEFRVNIKSDKYCTSTGSGRRGAGGFIKGTVSVF